MSSNNFTTISLEQWLPVKFNSQYNLLEDKNGEAFLILGTMHSKDKRQREELGRLVEEKLNFGIFTGEIKWT